MTIISGACVLAGGLALVILYGLLIKHVEAISPKDREAWTEFEEAMERYKRIRPGRQS